MRWVANIGRAPPGASIRACTATLASSVALTGRVSAACAVIGQRLRIALPMNSSVPPPASRTFPASTKHQCMASRPARSMARLSSGPPQTS